MTAFTPRLAGLVRRHPIWREASDPAVRALCAKLVEHDLRPGQNVLTAGEAARAIHLLIEGSARVYYPESPTRAETTVKLFGAPATFGDAESILRARWAETVQALTPVKVLIIPADAYFKLMQREPSVCFRQYWDVARRFGVAIQTERAANFSSSFERVVAVLVAYAHRFPEPSARGVVIAHPLTQDDLAVQTGSKRRSVVRALAELYKRGLVERVGRRFRVPDVEALVRAGLLPVPNMAFSTDERPWAE